MSKLSFYATAAVVAMFVFASVPARAENFTVDDFSSICGWSTNAVRCVVGDTVTLPAGTYTAVNPRAASVVDNVVTANEPGFTGIVDANGAVGGVIVLPQPAGSGKVYIYVAEIKEYGNGASLNICDPALWIFADGSPANGWPRAADDVAIFALGYSQKFSDDIGYGYNAFRLVPDGGSATTRQLTFGEMYLGTFAPYHCVVTLCGRFSDGLYEFKRTDGKVPRFVVAGCSLVNCGTCVIFQGYNSANFPTFDFSQGVEIDMGFADGYLSRTVLKFSDGKAILPKDTVLSMLNTKPNFNGTNSTDPCITIGSGFVWEGAGIIRNDSDGHMRVNAATGFEGSFEVGGTRGTKIEIVSPVGAGIDFMGHTGSNRTVVADGYITQANNGSDANKFHYAGGGSVKIGSADTTYGSSSPESAYPDHIRSVGQVILNGGNLGIWSGVGWSSLSDMTTRVDRLTLGKSTNKLFFSGASTAQADAGKLIPTNFVHIIKAENPNRAQALLYMTDLWNDNGTGNVSAPNVRLKAKIDNHAEISVGGVVPWMVAYGWKKALFIPMIDDDGFLYYDTPAESASLSAAPENGDVRLAARASLKINDDKTVKTLVVGLWSKTANDAKFGAGRTLTVSSGAVALPKGGGASYPTSGIGAEGATDNGTLKFGAPGYLYSNGSEDMVNFVHASMDAAQGLAVGYPGWTLITGNQTGVKEEFVVNGCTVTLGTENTEATFRVDMRVAGKGCLNIVNVNDDFLRKRKLTLDDCRNFPAKVNLASGTTYKVGELNIAGEKMKGGLTYGSGESAADVKDDVHFSGTGTVYVSAPGMRLFLR